MKERGFLLLLICFVASCASKPKPPADLIPESDMVQLMVDIRLLEGAYSLKYRDVDTSDMKIEAYYEKLFADRSVSASQFEKSYAYYSSIEGKMIQIEDSVMEKLSEIEAKAESENE